MSTEARRDLIQWEAEMRTELGPEGSDNVTIPADPPPALPERTLARALAVIIGLTAWATGTAGTVIAGAWPA